MIAVALIPPAATVGIGIAWGRPMVSLGSGVLVLVNLLSINLAALVVLRYSGYRPTQWFRLNEARGATVRRVAVLVVAIVVLSGFLGGVTYDSFQSAQTEDRIRAAAADTLAATAEARLLDVEVRRSNDVLFRTTESVVVTVGTDGGTAPSIAGPLDAAIENATGHPVDTEVRYVQVERA